MRLAFAFQIGHSPAWGRLGIDAAHYHRWALAIAGGDWLGDCVFYMSPLYAYFLGFVYRLVGSSVFSVRVIQLMLGVGSAGLIYALSRFAFGRRTGLAALAIALLYGPYVFYEAQLLKPVLATFLCAATLWATYWASADRAPWRWLLPGAVLGLAALARENVIPLLPVVMLWRVMSMPRRRRRPGAVQAMAMAVGFALAVLPATLRNYVVGRDVVLITCSGGFNFYCGNNLESNGANSHPSFTRVEPGEEYEDLLRCASQVAKRPVGPSEASGIWMTEAFRYIWAHPRHWLWLLWHKVYHFWSFDEIPDQFTDDYSYFRWRADTSRLLWFPLSFGALAPCALWGLLAAARRPRRPAPLFMFAAVYMTTCIAFCVTARYRLPVTVALIPFAAHGIASLVAAARLRKAAELTLAVGLVSVAAFAVNRQDPDWNLRDHIGNSARAQGMALLRRARTREALDYLQRAHGFDERNPAITLSLVQVYLQLHMIGEAREAIDTMRSFDRNEPRVPHALGLVALKEGRDADAEVYLEKARTLAPHLFARPEQETRPTR